jgi:hypothetical protein
MRHCGERNHEPEIPPDTRNCHSEGISTSRGDTPSDENVAQTSCLQLVRLQAGSLRYLIFVVNLVCFIEAHMRYWARLTALTTVPSE